MEDRGYEVVAQPDLSPVNAMSNQSVPASEVTPLPLFPVSDPGGVSRLSHQNPPERDGVLEVTVGQRVRKWVDEKSGKQVERELTVRFRSLHCVPQAGGPPQSKRAETALTITIGLACVSASLFASFLDDVPAKQALRVAAVVTLAATVVATVFWLRWRRR